MGPTLYSTKEMAEKKIMELSLTEVPLWFCPLIKTVCRKDCLCFVNYKALVNALAHILYRDRTATTQC